MRSMPGPAGAPPVESGYRLGRRLDRGGADEVYEADHPTLPGRFAVEIHRRALAAGPQAADAFRREAAVVSSLRHPHIAQVLEIGTLPDGVPFVVMEELHGQTLAQLLAARRAVSALEAVGWVSAIAGALTAAHGAGIVHGELRPEKIFLAQVAGYERGFAKLLGFGLRHLAPSGRRGLDAGAARFMAPELAEGRGPGADGRSDQFSLAAMAYRMIAGSDAFQGDDPVTVVHRVLRETPTPLTELVRCDPVVDAVVRRGLAKRADQRFPSVLAFAGALDEAVAGSKPVITQTVAQSQVVSVAPLVAGSAIEVEQDDVVSESFFAEGLRQEARGHYVEQIPQHYDGPLDRVPRRRGPMLMLVLLLLGAGAGAAWWAGWRPPAAWQQSAVWRTLRLPPIGP
jgi:serine/threonine-protein kinase